MNFPGEGQSKDRKPYEQGPRDVKEQCIGKNEKYVGAGAQDTWEKTQKMI